MYPVCCIFDLDGVICDTAQFHYLAWLSLAREMDIPFTIEDNERLKGVSRMDSLDILLSLKPDVPVMSQAKKQELAARKNELYLTYIARLTPQNLLSGVHSLIVGLREAGVKICLGSVSKNAPMILKLLGITELFDIIVDGNVVSRAKPAPDVFLESSSRLGIDPADCIVFEDAVAGVEAAHAAQMKCVGVGDGKTLSSADWVISGFEGFGINDLYNLVGEGG